MADKLTGKASYINCNGVQLYITKYTPKVTRTNADTTDSADYEASIDMVNPSQIPVMNKLELAVEGYYHRSQTTAALLALCYSNANAFQVILGLDAGTLFGHGAFDLTDFGAEVPLTDTVKYTCSLTQNGPFTPGA